MCCVCVCQCGIGMPSLTRAIFRSFSHVNTENGNDVVGWFGFWENERMVLLFLRPSLSAQPFLKLASKRTHTLMRQLQHFCFFLFFLLPCVSRGEYCPKTKRVLSGKGVLVVVLYFTEKCCCSFSSFTVLHQKLSKLCSF